MYHLFSINESFSRVYDKMTWNRSSDLFKLRLNVVSDLIIQTIENYLFKIRIIFFYLNI